MSTPDHIAVNVAPLLAWIRGDQSYYVGFLYQDSCDRWLAMCGRPEFHLLSTAVVNSLLTEAFVRKLSVYSIVDGVPHRVWVRPELSPPAR